MKHRFPSDFSFDLPEHFTDPFRYFPHESVRVAASLTIRHIDSDPMLSEAFSEGKMLGVLVCTSRSSDKQNGDLYYIAGFSGNVGGKSCIDGFVPPIYDLTAKDGYFKIKEAEITDINKEIEELTNSEELISLRRQLSETEEIYKQEVESTKKKMEISRTARNEKRNSTDNPDELNALIRKSQHEKAELKRLKSYWEEKIQSIKEKTEGQEAYIRSLKTQRAQMSERLQDWIFSQYRVHNYLGENTTIAELFSSLNLTPPGGTGECAAPKLLQYAYLNDLKPLAMGEFWYGHPSDTAVRVQGHFYPSCTSKCGPLLSYMLKGLAISSGFQEDQAENISPVIIHDDDSIVVVEKPSGMPSVPGLDKRYSLQEWLSDRYDSEIYSVHRLDMDTSGVMVFAKTKNAEISLKKQFENRSVCKRYLARLSSEDKSESCKTLELGSKGIIDLPLSADYDERPRQKVDYVQGKSAVTIYKVISENSDGTTDIIFEPITGRTHQLRVHSAHHNGLSRPIVGDLLYGGSESRFLNLKAIKITFRHPETGKDVSYSSVSSEPSCQ